MNTLFRIAIAVSVVSLAACQATPPANRGASGGRIDPSADSPAEYGSRSLRSQDLITATDKMAQDIAQRLDISNRKSPPKIFVGEIENKTSASHENLQVFLTRLRAQLNSLGSRNGMEFVRERQFIETQREREYGNDQPESSAAAYRSRADFVLTCEVRDLPSGDTDYYLLDYQLVQLRDASSGPDVGAGAIVWEGMYEVKYQ